MLPHCCGALTICLSVFLFQADGVGHAESKIPYVLKYELPVAGQGVQKHHTVTFTHSRHAMAYDITCVRCHHTLKPGAATVDESCWDCHSRAALRNLREQGVPREARPRPYLMALHAMCIDCHKEIQANDPRPRVPLACWQCHVRERDRSIEEDRSDTRIITRGKRMP